jgi:hypothetical protein
MPSLIDFGLIAEFICSLVTTHISSDAFQAREELSGDTQAEFHRQYRTNG